MLLDLMEGDTKTNIGLFSSIKDFENKQHGNIKTLLKNFILPEPDMAIKQNQSDKCVYTVPVKLPTLNMTERMKTINKAKIDFLNSTVNPPKSPPRLYPNRRKREETTIHYASLAMTTENDDPRSTGGGKDKNENVASLKTKTNAPASNISPIIKNRFEQHQRKVSFKTKSASACYRRPPIAAKTMTVTSTNVSELTKRFNSLQNESQDGVSIPSKLAKTIEDLATASRGPGATASNSSTPSSTLSSSPNIKIVLRQKRGSKKRNSKKRCSSMDSIDQLVLKNNTTTKIHVIRSKSDGTKIPKSSKKRLKYHDSSEQQSGSDSVDGSPVKAIIAENKEKNKPPETLKVKNVIKKFECEINAHTHSSNTLKRQPDRTKSTTPIKEKPKVPEKKSSLVLTKNVVVKDGVPKFRTIKLPVNEPTPEHVSKSIPKVEIVRKKEPLYDRKKYKTNYIHTDKMPLKVVEIIPEDINENVTPNTSEHNITMLEASSKKYTESNAVESQEMKSHITPNDSFLWRRKSTTQIYVDSDTQSSESPYCFISSTMNQSEYMTYQLESDTASNDTVKILINETQERDSSESQESEKKCATNMDFESNLVEAYNKEVLVGFTTKPKKVPDEENDYEPLEPRDDHVVIIPIKSIEGPKVNCPLPEIPKQVPCTGAPETPEEEKGNIYQCLLEMRSHPEGDESSLHNYEVCENALEERTRGDGDSDDGYEYCKSPIKPYCHTSSSGITIAEDYQPCSNKNNIKNYVISKSVSGTSTVSYEKIGPERIYEKIPNLSPKSKDSSASSRHSLISDYNGYNDNENIYDTIKHSDGASLSHCYESIPNSPSTVKLRSLKKNNSVVQKRLSFDTVSNISHSTMSSEQKTNSIYGQRSVISYNGQEIAFQVPSSETSVSDRSDRSDDWVDVSDEEKNDEQKIIIVRERSRGRKSPISWSQKVRHQWQKTPKKNEENVSVTSPSNVYIDTNAKLPYYSRNDELAKKADLKRQNREDNVKLIEVLEQNCWLSIRTVLRHADIEIQDIVAFIECDSSDSGHLYESLEPRAPAPPPPHHIPHDSDSFDSDTDSEDHDKSAYGPLPPTLPASRLPTPPSGGGQYTLTKIASAAQKKMKQIKRNLTKRYSVAMDGNPFKSPPTQDGIYDTIKPAKKVPIYANYEKPDINVYSNVNLNDSNKTEYAKGALKDELKYALGEKRLSNGEPPPLPDKPDKVDKPVTPTDTKKDSGTLSRKAYLSLKSRFRRATSIAVDINDVPSALKITNSTFYLTDSMDGDSGFSNCSDTAAGSSETLTSRRREGTRMRSPWAESSPCLALERPAVPPPPPPTAPGATVTPGATSPGATSPGGFSSAHLSGVPSSTGGLSPMPPARLSSSVLNLSPSGASLTPNGANLSPYRASLIPNGASLSPYRASLTPNGASLSPNGASLSPAGIYGPVVTGASTAAPGPASPPSRTSTDLSAVNEELKRLLPTLSRKEKAPRARTSWYAECGSDLAPALTQQSNTSWYAEAGLYQAGNVSTSSGASSGSQPASPLPHSLFTHEPLYQFYNAAKVQSVYRETGDSDSDAYSAAPTPAPAPPSSQQGPPQPSRPSAMALVAPRGPARTLWCEVPEVLESAVLSSLAPAQKRLQEAKFELLTSEASYLNSLNVLEAHFIAHPAFRETSILPRADWETLFSTILPVRKCSQLLMNELEKCWQENILLAGICDIVRAHAEAHFHVYVKYCENQALMVKALQRLRDQPLFAAALKRIESHPACQSLSLHSFLMLPMQRVTRLPLLLDAVLRHLADADAEHQPCMHALATLNNFVSQCNEGARNTERIEEMFRLAQIIEFPPNIRHPPSLGPACGRRDRRPVRWLVRSGEMTQLIWKTDESKLTFGKKFQKLPLYLFLFNDLLVITKKKSDEMYVALDHCPRSLLEVSASEGGTASAKHALLLTLLENHDGRTVEMVMSCPSETDASRWAEALAAGAGNSEGGEAVYAGWDCPQVCALFAYSPAQPDELTLAEGDVVNVTRKTSEGWYYGERTRDGEAGWFPGAYTAEIASAHVRARNLKQRYRLLALSGTYFGQKKRI